MRERDDMHLTVEMKDESTGTSIPILFTVATRHRRLPRLSVVRHLQIRQPFFNKTTTSTKLKKDKIVEKGYIELSTTLDKRWQLRR